MNTNYVTITGNTYPVKDQIKDLGGRWDANAKGWRVPADKADEVRRLVASAPAKVPGPAVSTTYRRPYRGGYGRRKGCVSDGNCSSMGSGKSCGGHDCDGW